MDRPARGLSRLVGPRRGGAHGGRRRGLGERAFGGATHRRGDGSSGRPVRRSRQAGDPGRLDRRRRAAGPPGGDRGAETAARRHHRPRARRPRRHRATWGQGLRGGVAFHRPAAREPSHAGAAAGDGGGRPVSERARRIQPKYVLHTSRFEALRWRTGRRSRAQLAAMDWSDDPAPVLDHLYLFGPADADVVE